MLFVIKIDEFTYLKGLIIEDDSALTKYDAIRNTIEKNMLQSWVSLFI